VRRPSNHVLPTLIEKENTNSESEWYKDMFDRYALSHQLYPARERWTYPGQESILEEGDITEEEQECKTGKHGRWDPPVPCAGSGGEGAVLED
jgi:hypothetical protein